MYSKSPSRSNRSRGFKVKHILQVSVLVAVCFWLIYQVKHSHEKKKEFDEKDARLASDTQSDGRTLRLGRKDISRAREIGIGDKSNGEDEEENDADQAENRREDDEQEERESRSDDDREDEEDTGRAGEDDETDKHGEEKSDDEINEESVDEEKDRVVTVEKNEDNTDGEKEENEESETVLEDRDSEGGTGNTHEAREEHYKADDASSEVAHDTRGVIPETENATLKNMTRSSILITDSKESARQSSNQSLLEENSSVQIESSNTSDSRVSEYSLSGNTPALTGSSNQSQARDTLIQIEPLRSLNTTQAQNAASEDIQNEGFNPTLNLFSRANTLNSSSEKSQLDITTVVNSTELANTTTSTESLGSSMRVPENITGSTEEMIDDVISANADTDDNPGSNSENNVTGGENEGSISNTAGVDDLHDNVDDFGASLAQEEKEYRTDPGTLPDIKVEVQNADDLEAE